MEISVVQAAVLGLVQGLTEFIPVSSTAHLRIVPALLGWGDPGAAFSAVIQLGTLAAMVFYFAGDIRRLTLAALRSVVHPEKRREPEALLAWRIAAGNLPIIVLGLGFKNLIETQARGLFLIAAMLVLVALGLAALEWRLRKSGGSASPGTGMNSLTLSAVMGIGFWQALALIPGTSRSGATLLGAMLAGMNRAEAARFSFLLGIPAIFGGGLLELKPVVEGVQSGNLTWMALGVGLLTATLSGYAAIEFLLRYLRTRTTLIFVGYRLMLAGLVVALALVGAIR